MEKTPLEIIEQELNKAGFKILTEVDGSFTFDTDEVSANYIHVHAQNDDGMLIDIEYNEENSDSENPRLTITDENKEDNFAVTYPKGNEAEISYEMHRSLEEIIQNGNKVD